MSRSLRSFATSIGGTILLVALGIFQTASAQELGKAAPGFRSADQSIFQAKKQELKASLLAKALLPLPPVADTLANTGFEDDPTVLDPWVQVDSGDAGWFVQTGTTPPLGGDPVPAPPEGTQAAMTAEGDPGTAILYQDVALLSAPANIQLTYNLFAHNFSGAGWVVPADTLSYSDGTNQSIRVDIMDPSYPADDVGAGVWMRLYRSKVADPDSFGYTPMTADLSSFAGDTVRLRFAMVVTNAEINMGVDSVRLVQTPIFPGVPTLLDPYNEQMDVPLSEIELQWSAVTYAIRYDVEVATDPAFSHIIWATNVPANQTKFTPPNPSTIYYWRVRSVGVHGHVKGPAAWSTPFRFYTVPGAPTLLTPLNGAVDVPLAELELRWTSVPFATRYNIQVSTDAAFSSILWSTNVGAHEVKFTPPTQGVTYYWRAQSEGQTSAAKSNFSAPFHFTTVNPRPGVVTLVSPVFGATDLPTTVPLVWNAAAYADSYTVQVSMDSTFADTLFSAETGDLTMGFFAPYAGKTYFWRVEGMGPGGTSPGFSDVWKFTVGMTGPLAPESLHPEDGATGVPVDPWLSWSAPSVVGKAEKLSKAAEIAFYHVQVATDSTFDSPTVDQDSVMADSVQVFGLMHETEYYWRVAGVDDVGQFTYTAPLHFTTIVAAPAAVTLVAPANDATGTSASPEFSWQSIDGVTAYQLQVSTDAGFGTTVVDEDALTGTTFTPAAPLDYSTKYYWRMRAMNEGGWGDWSDAFNFTTAVGTAVSDDAIPTTYALHENYPNPFNPTTKIVLDLPQATSVKLAIYTIDGQEVMRLATGQLSAGRHSFTVDGTRLSSGVYLYRVESAAFTQTKRMTLLK